MSIENEEFEYVSTLVRSDAGLVLDKGKEYLVEARLRPLVQEAGLTSVRDFVQRLRMPSANALRRRVIEAMTTNETSFFRDMHPFDSLRKTILPKVIENRRDERRLFIWSAACSTGQEPYTIAMIIRENFPELANWTCRIVATDISREVLARAQSGRYSQLEVNRGMPVQYLSRYFVRDKLDWEIRKEIRSMVEFVEMNLTQTWPPLPRMDIIFLRNVLIYFDVTTKRRIFEGVRRQLRHDGYLLLGNCETTLGVHDGFERQPDDRGGWHRVKK
ncbi:MAG TPA: CheR family methyltransferase [Candidatus Binataceae bacterium]|nr:CheR family methyltransferase [Candidatus Binataceae bacterium]